MKEKWKGNMWENGEAKRECCQRWEEKAAKGSWGQKTAKTRCEKGRYKHKRARAGRVGIQT